MELHIEDDCTVSATILTNPTGKAVRMNIEKIPLSKFVPSRWRRFDLDPIMPERVEHIARSIEDNGFIGAVTGGWRDDGCFELAAGHNRVEACRLLKHKAVDAYVVDLSDIGSWSIGQAENASQRGELIGAALDSCAALIRLVAMLHFEGRDVELRELMGAPTGGDCNDTPSTRRDRDPIVQKIANVKSSIDRGEGIGNKVLVGIKRERRRLHAKPGDDAKPDSRGLAAIREAVATLKASGEHDRIIASEAEKVRERREREAAEAEERAIAEETRARLAEEASKRAEAERQRRAEEEAKKRAEAKAAEEDAAAERDAAMRARKEADAVEAKRRAEAAAARKAEQDAAAAKAAEEAKAAKSAASDKAKDAKKAVKVAGATEAAATKSVDAKFDHRCNEVFQQPNHLEYFRSIILQTGFQSAVPFANQLEVARQTREYCERTNVPKGRDKGEITELKMREFLTTQLNALHGLVKTQDEEAMREMSYDAIKLRLNRARQDMNIGIDKTMKGLGDLSKILAEWPFDDIHPLDIDFIRKLERFGKAFDVFAKSIKLKNAA